MTRQIGFSEFEKAWEGPVYLEFSRYSDHSKTVRYKSRLKTREFDLYAPLFMLNELAGPQPPQKLIAAIGKARSGYTRLGFRPHPIGPECTRKCASINSQTRRPIPSGTT
jgi:hypothetical protein